MTWLLRFLLLVMFFFLIRKVVAYLFGGGSSSTVKRKPPSGTRAIEGQMVKDPQCGMYVASSLAVTLDHGTERLYFCSEDCREGYLKEKRLEEPSRS